MRGHSLLLAATLIVSASTAAIADTSAGTVLRFNNQHSVTLNTGEVFSLPRSGMANNVSAGDYVIIGWSFDGTGRVASSVYKPDGTKGSEPR